MAGVPPKKNTAYTIYVGLEDKANPGLFKASPTLATGDWKIAIDDGAPANLATLPVVDADFTKRVKVALSADEMNGDHITIIASDAAGAEWYDLQINIDTDAKQIGDLATQTSVDDVPTVAEFNARTLPTASYFDPATDTVTPAGGQINSVLGSIGGDVEGKVLGGGSGTITGVGTSANVTYSAGEELASRLATKAEIDAALALLATAAALGVVDTNVDSIKTITDNIDVSAVTYVAASNAGYLTITIGRTFNQLVTELVIPVDVERTYFTIKQSVEDDETESILQLLSSNPEDTDVDGVQRLNGVLWHEAVVDDTETETDETSPEPFDRDLGTLIVNQGNGSIRIFLTHKLTVQLASAKRIGWDVKFIDSNGDSTGKRGVVDLVRTETQTI